MKRSSSSVECFQTVVSIVLCQMKGLTYLIN